MWMDKLSSRRLVIRENSVLSVLVIMKGWNDKQTFLCVSGRKRRRMAIAFNEEHGGGGGGGEEKGFVPTPKEFSKNEGKRERRGGKKSIARTKHAICLSSLSYPRAAYAHLTAVKRRGSLKTMRLYDCLWMLVKFALSYQIPSRYVEEQETSMPLS